MAKKTIIILGILFGLFIAISFVGAIDYYNLQCKKLTQGDIAFMNAISPAYVRNHEAYIASHPFTDTEREFLNQVTKVQKERCMKIINGE